MTKWIDLELLERKVILQQVADKEHLPENYRDILNFFDHRSTNASAESFNSKIKNFRAQLRGVSDVRYFLFRLQKIYA